MERINLKFKTLTIVLVTLAMSVSVQSEDEVQMGGIRVPRGVSQMVAQLLFGGKPAGDLYSSSSSSTSQKSNSPLYKTSFNSQSNYDPSFNNFQLYSQQPATFTNENYYESPSEDESFTYESSNPADVNGFAYEGSTPLISSPIQEPFKATPTRNQHGPGYLMNLVASGSNYIGNMVRRKEGIMGKLSSSVDSYWNSLPSFLPRRRKTAQTTYSNIQVPSYEEEYYSF